MELIFVITFTLILILLQSDIVLGNANSLIPEDARLDFSGLATKFGHPAIRYDVTTEDGYILTLFHIPGRGKIPVLLLHGFLDTSDSYVLRGNNSIAISLANEGYDVWLGNCRGNRYSRRHRALDPNRDSAYWEYSLHELGYYDLPAFIDRVLNETGAPSLTAIGHSQGNTIFYILGSTRPEYNSKVNVMIALAPVCYFHNVPFPLQTILFSLPLFYEALKSVNVQVDEFLGYDSVPSRLLRLLCPQNFISVQMCIAKILNPVFGFDPFLFEPGFMNIYIYHYPAGASWRSLLHFIQINMDKIFRQYDFGNDKNIKVYNSTSPPVYDLREVTMPVALITAKNDPISRFSTVELLKQQLPNVADYVVIPYWFFNHGDYVWLKSAPTHLFPHLRRILLRFNPLDGAV